MKSMILVALALVAVAVALPVEEPVEILKSSFESQPNGAYNFLYQGADGNSRQETGELKEVLNEEGKPVLVVVVRGSYGYLKADGTQETVSYSADENGYSAEGPSIPKNERR